MSLLVLFVGAQPRESGIGRDMEMPSFGRQNLPPDFGPKRPLRPPPEESKPERHTPTVTPTPITVPAPTPRTASVSQSHIDEEFLFLRSSYGTAEPVILDSLAAQARALLVPAREGDRADQIQFLLLEIRRKQERPIAAVIEGLKLLYEYPGSTLTFNVKRVVHEVVEKRIKRRRKEISAITKGPRIGMSRAERLGALLEKLASFSDSKFYGPTVVEFREFFERYPHYANRDSLSFLLAGLHARNGFPHSAVFLYERILALSSKKPLKASALSAVGGLYAGALDDPERAVGAYQSLADGFPEFEEAQTAYGKWARLLDAELKQPILAVEVLEKAVQLYPNSDAAHDALSESARILARRLKNRPRAVETLERLAEMFPGPRAVAGLRRAAVLHGEAREYAAQARTLVRLRRRYPDDAFSPQALWTAARLYDKKLGDDTAARRVYSDLIESFPKHRFGKKAKRRLESLD